MEILHLCVTRFNLKVPTWSKSTHLRLDEDWLDARRVLFKATSLSISKQINRNFKWVVLFDKETSKDYIDSLGPGFEPVMLEGLEGFKRYLKGKKDVITSRLDSDDMLGPSFIDDVQRTILYNGSEIVSFDQGYIKEKDSYYKIFWSANPFLSLYEKSSAQGVYNWEHGALMRQPGARVFARRNWLINIHGGNLRNDKRLIAGGIRCLPPKWMQDC